MPTPAPAPAVVGGVPTPPVVPIGRAVLEGIRDGRFPPPATATLLDLDLVDVGEGTTTFRFRPDARFDNGAGVTHGGILATVVDFAVTTAVATVASEGALASTARLHRGWRATLSGAPPSDAPKPSMGVAGWRRWPRPPPPSGCASPTT